MTILVSVCPLQAETAERIKLVPSTLYNVLYGNSDII